jgi:hypothetical protein
MNDGINPTQLARKDMDRLKGYRELLDFYHGRQWPKGYNRGKKQLTFNYSKVVIGKVTSYLIPGLHTSVEAAEETTEARDRARRIQAALKEVYRENGPEQLDFETR